MQCNFIYVHVSSVYGWYAVCLHCTHIVKVLRCCLTSDQQYWNFYWWHNNKCDIATELNNIFVSQFDVILMLAFVAFTMQYLSSELYLVCQLDVVEDWAFWYKIMKVFWAVAKHLLTRLHAINIISRIAAYLYSEDLGCRSKWFSNENKDINSACTLFNMEIRLQDARNKFGPEYVCAEMWAEQ